MKKRVVISALCVIGCVMLASCGTRGNQDKDPLTGEEETQEQGSEEQSSTSGDATGDDFDSLLNNESTDANGIMDYINTNISTAGESDVRRFFTSLLGFGDDIRDIDFTQLDESRQYMPEDMVAFMELMKLEGESPSMVMSDEENRRVIGLTLSEMLERALLYEQHIMKYPNDASTDAAVRLYEEIASNAITGGYDKSAGVEHYYKGDTSDVVDQESLQYYQQFAEANADSNLGSVVQEYITILQQNQFQINENMEEFYHSLYEKLVIDTKQGTTIGNDGTGESETGSTGTTGNGSTTGSMGNTGNGNTSGTNAGNENTAGSMGNTGNGNTAGTNAGTNAN